MKIMNYYILFLSSSYLTSFTMFILESLSIIKIDLIQFLPRDLGMAFYFLTVGTLYGYAFFKPIERIFKPAILIASIMSVALMFVQIIHNLMTSINQILLDSRMEVFSNVVRIETILGILSAPILFKEREDD